MNGNEHLQDTIKKIQYENIIYSINEEEKTAEIIENDINENFINIPRNIEYENQKYAVTIIREKAFKYLNQVTSIQFPIDSELKIIEKEAFFFTAIESITIPSSVKELRQGWCNGMNKLNQIKIMPNNPNFICLNEKIALGKSSSEKVDFDVLICSVKNIIEIDIPNSIEIIRAHAFEGCKHLCKVNISTDSKLKIIEKNAFKYTSIENFKVPPHLTTICEGAFYDCYELKNFEIPQNSELQTIEEFAFSSAPIQSLTIPSSLIHLEENWCFLTEKLNSINIIPNNPRYSKYKEKYIIGKSSLEKNFFDVFVFCPRDEIDEVEIPDFIEIIGSSAFGSCLNLSTVNFSINSNLRIIEKSAFSNSSINKISIPLHLIKISQYAFYQCQRLQQIEIPENSKLQEIEEKAFYDSSIESFTIPSNLIKLENGWCNHLNNLNKIDVNQNNQIYSKFNDNLIIGKSSIEKENFDVLVFSVRNVKTVEIPDFIEIISPHAFHHCTRLQKVKISCNSKLKSIEKFAFNESSIKSIYIPPKLKKICGNSFAFCEKLNTIEIPKNSELQIIESQAFVVCSFKSIFIPYNVNIINNGSFICLHNLLVEIDENSQLKDLNSCSFLNCIDAVIMIPANLKDILNLN